jgi:glycylpeptide N-tetradecanoyltransferase
MELYTLLKNHYVEDSHGEFRFDYSPEFIKWALNPPGFVPEWILGVRSTEKKTLFAFISGVPVHMTVSGKEVLMAEINFLCGHKGLRANRLAPVLIKEITRRVNLCDIWQAVYTAGKTLPTPIATAQYWHRNLNFRKLVDIGFSYLPSDKNMA